MIVGWDGGHSAPRVGCSKARAAAGRPCPSARATARWPKHPGRVAEPAVHWLTLQPGGRRVPVAAGQTLLQAALAAGIHLPSSCRNGTCRSCISRLLEGEITYQIDWPGLLAEEKAEGWVLPCVACARSDLLMDAPQAGPLFG